MRRINFLNRHKGQAALVIVYVIGMAALLVSLALSTTGVTQVQIGAASLSSLKAFYVSQAGVEDLYFRLKQNQSLASDLPFSISGNLNGGRYDATISAISPTERLLVSTGIVDTFWRKIEVKLTSAAAGDSLIYAVQTGRGGFELESNSTISCIAPCTEGNIYTNGDIKGEKKRPASAASRITGSAWAHQEIKRLASGDSGVWIEKNASAAALIDCLVDGDQFALAQNPNSGCPLAAGKKYTQTANPPPILALPPFNPDFWKKEATNSAKGGGIFIGDCRANSGRSDDCTNGSGTLGFKKITGNLILPSNTNLTLTGPVWVVGTTNIESNNIIGLSPRFTNYGTVFIGDGPILAQSNVTFPQQEKTYLLFASTYSDGLDCANPAITISSNTNSIIFYALNGCVTVATNATFYGVVVGEKVHIRRNSTVYYDQNLVDARFASRSVGGWAVTDWREIE